MNTNTEKIPYLIVTPSFTFRSGGIIVLHKLCDWLNKFGSDAYLYPLLKTESSFFKTNPKYLTPIYNNLILQRNPIVVYPDIISENPLNSKRVVRWLLNRPGAITGKEINFSKNDVVYEHSPIHFTEKTAELPLMLKVNDMHFDLFKDYGMNRSGSCFFIHKGSRSNINYSLHNSRDEIKDLTPTKELADYLNKKKYFYCYDNASFAVDMANLCGVISVIIPDGSRSKNQVRKAHPYGVAYGVEDIPHAIDTLHLAKKWLYEKHQLNKNSVLEFVNNTQNIFSDKEPPLIKSKKNAELVSIIILSFNTLKFTRRTIESIISSTKFPYEIIVVDNASRDGSVEYLKFISKKYKNIKVLYNKVNNGFSAGNNQAVKYANGDYIMILNSDVLVFDGWLSSLVETLNSHKKVGAVGTLSNSISGRQQIKTTYKNEDEYIKFAKVLNKKNKGKILPRRRLAGFAILLKKDLYKKISGFDEDYEIGNFEDDDFSLKIAKEGYALMVDESVLIHHYGSQSFKSNNLDYNLTMQINQKIFKSKWPNVNYNELLEIENSLLDWEKNQIKDAFKLFEMKKFDQALKLVNEALKTSPLSIELLYIKSLLLMDMNENQKSLKLLDKIISLGYQDASIYNQQGIALISVNQSKKAVVSFQNAIDLDPTNIVNYKLRSEAFLMIDNFESAIDSLTETFNIFPDDLDTKERLLSLSQNFEKVN